jgi:hypothetical protein
MKTHRKSECGSTLLISAMLTGILSVTLVGYLKLVSHQQNMLARAQQWNFALPVAEAGIEEALTHIHYFAHGSNIVDNGWEIQSTSGKYFKTNSLGTGRYNVTMAANSVQVTIVAEGYVKLEPSNTELKRTIEVKANRFSLFPRGLVAKGQIDMNGNNIRADSFDSDSPYHSTGRRYDPDKAKNNGDVATNSGLINSVNVGNAEIYGHVATGPGGSIAIGPNGGVGDSEWHRFHNGVKPGWVTDDMNVSFPDVMPPYSSGAAPASGTIGSVSYSYVLGQNEYYMTSLSMSSDAKMIVTNDAVLYINGSFSMSGQSQIIVATNASLKLYVNGSASIGGQGVINNNAVATNFFYYGCTNNTSLSLSGNAGFTGVIYAPQAALSLVGGGNDKTDLDFVGACVAKTVKMNGHFNFHYDEALSRYGASSEFLITSWREL